MIFSEEFYIGYSDVNRDFLLSDTAALKMFENSACMHSTAVGDGMRTSASRWFLKSYHVKFLCRPQYEEKVKVCTWSRNIKGASASREFEIYSKDKSLAVTAVSNWVRVCAATLKPERISPETFDCYKSETERTNFSSPWIDKLREPENYSYEKEFIIGRNFIDPNNHMNNVYYLDLAYMTLPENIYEKGGFNEFEIMYRKAITCGERVKCMYSETEDAYMTVIKSSDLSDTFALIKLYK